MDESDGRVVLALFQDKQPPKQVRRLFSKIAEFITMREDSRPRREKLPRADLVRLHVLWPREIPVIGTFAWLSLCRRILLV